MALFLGLIILWVFSSGQAQEASAEQRLCCRGGMFCTLSYLIFVLFRKVSAFIPGCGTTDEYKYAKKQV